MSSTVKITLLIGLIVAVLLGIYFIVIIPAPDSSMPVTDTYQPSNTLSQAEKDELARQLNNSQSAAPESSGQPQTLSSSEESQIKKDMTATQPSRMSAAQRNKLIEQMSAQ